MIRRFVAVVTACALAGCLEGKKFSDVDAPIAASSSSAAGTYVLPTGIAAPARAAAHPAEIDGIYPSTDARDRCCWLAPDAHFTFAAPASATSVELALLVPLYPFFESIGQSLTIEYGPTRMHLAALAPGVHRVKIDLAGPHRTLRIRAERTFVPAREGVNADTRPLAIQLIGIDFR